MTAYWVLLHTVGTSRYLPYMGLLLAVHAASAMLLFTLIRRRTGDIGRCSRPNIESWSAVRFDKPIPRAENRAAYNRGASGLL